MAVVLCLSAASLTACGSSGSEEPARKLVWSDEFDGANGALPDASKWKLEQFADATDDEKQSQLRRLAEFSDANAALRPADLQRLRDAALAGENLFDVLMDAVRTCSLGQITDALFEVGGRYRRNV